jgi:hypothetical protein
MTMLTGFEVGRVANRRYAASLMHNFLLRNYPDTNPSYDGDRTVSAASVLIYYDAQAIAVSFTNPDPTPDGSATAICYIPGDAGSGAVVAIVAGLLNQLAPLTVPDPAFTLYDQLVDLHAEFDRRLDNENADRQYLLEELLRRLSDLADDTRRQVRSS